MSRKQFYIIMPILCICVIGFLMYYVQIDSENLQRMKKQQDKTGEIVYSTEEEEPEVIIEANTLDKEEPYKMDRESYIEPYCSMSADWGSELYESGFVYYKIPKKLKEEGGCLPEIVQVYIWSLCNQTNIDYYMVLALIEEESGYKYDLIGDGGNSIGYMQVYEYFHKDKMEEENVESLLDPYGNIRVGINYLSEIEDKYGVSSGDNCVLMVYNMGESRAKELWNKGTYSSEYSRRILQRAKEIKQELTQE